MTKQIDRLRRTIRKIMLEDTSGRSEFLKWKRRNVTIRGTKNPGESNNSGISGSLGDGLYTAFLGNRELAKQYGRVYFVVNAIPKNPLVLNTVNEWQIWLANLIYKKLGYQRRSDFSSSTTIEREIMKLGYDGVIIKGREMVNYTPSDVLYFSNEGELYDYWENNVR